MVPSVIQEVCTHCHSPTSQNKICHFLCPTCSLKKSLSPKSTRQRGPLRLKVHINWECRKRWLRLRRHEFWSFLSLRYCITLGQSLWLLNLSLLIRRWKALKKDYKQVMVGVYISVSPREMNFKYPWDPADPKITQPSRTFTLGRNFLSLLWSHWLFHVDQML